jgi:hypothetical protein
VAWLVTKGGDFNNQNISAQAAQPSGHVVAQITMMVIRPRISR